MSHAENTEDWRDPTKAPLPKDGTWIEARIERIIDKKHTFYEADVEFDTRLNKWFSSIGHAIREESIIIWRPMK